MLFLPRRSNKYNSVSLIVACCCRGWLGQKLHGKDYFNRVACYSLTPPQKNLSMQILMLTGLIIESAIKEREEIQSGDEQEQLICMADMKMFYFNIQQAEFFCI